jgi:hypothetical protein
MLSQEKTVQKIKKVRATRLIEYDEIKIDGKLNEPIWNNSNSTDQFIQIEPIEGGEPSNRSILTILYDDDFLYVGARLFNQRDSLVAHLVRRDNGTNSDYCVFCIDTYADKMNAYFFQIDAAGSMLDGEYYNDSWNSLDWDGVWEGKASVDEFGWTCEMKIPFSQMRFKNEENLNFKVNFYRYQPMKQEKTGLVFPKRQQSGFVSHFVDLVGITHIRQKSSLEIMPYVTSKLELKRYPDEDPLNKNIKYPFSFGGDLKYVFGKNMTLNVAINPDFGQVEIDPSVINLSDVETYYSEKRPFFLEGINKIFGFGQRGVNSYWSMNWWDPTLYTRRVGGPLKGSLPDYDYKSSPDGVRILEAIKLTGTIGDDWKIGLIQALTKREYVDIYASEKKYEVEAEPLSSYNVIRVIKDFDSAKYSVGLLSMLTIRDFKDTKLESDFNKNSIFTGLDGYYRFGKDQMWALTGWWAMTYLEGSQGRLLELQTSSVRYFQRPDAKNISVDSNLTSLFGTGGRLHLNKEKGNLIFSAAISYVTPEFESNDLSMLPRSNIINMHTVFGYKTDKPYGIIHRSWNVMALRKNMDFDFNNISSVIIFNSELTFINYYDFGIQVAHELHGMSNTITRGGPLMHFNSADEIRIYGSTDSRKRIIIYPAFYLLKGKNRYYETYTDLSFDFNYWTNFNFSISGNYDKFTDYNKWIDNFYDEYAINTYKKRYVFGVMDQVTYSGSIRFNYIFAPNISLQLYVQPLLSSAKFSTFKDLAKSGTGNFNIYSESDISRKDGEITIDPDGNGPSPALTFDDPDFIVRSIRANMIFRWEYMPGSSLYLVWTQSRFHDVNSHDFNFSNLAEKLFDKNPDNIFMLKLTYWIQP